MRAVHWQFIDSQNRVFSTVYYPDGKQALDEMPADYFSLTKMTGLIINKVTYE
jgi:hypothetical protein